MNSADFVVNSIIHIADTLRNISLDAESISGAVDLLCSTDLPVVCSGVGKSGFIAAKLVATLNSFGICAVFLNPTDALHGDLGCVADGSVVVLFSNSGTTSELRSLLPALQLRDCKIISVVSDGKAPLAEAATHAITYGKLTEIDELGLAPTTSTVIQLALADAIAAATSRERNFTRHSFYRNHPAGALGKRLMKVEALMRQNDNLPLVAGHSPLTEVFATISAKRIGCTCVVDADGRLIGIITDGDIRRGIEQKIDIYNSFAADLMQKSPRTAKIGEYVEQLMKKDDFLGRHFIVPVVDDDHILRGVLVSIDLI